MSENKPLSQAAFAIMLSLGGKIRLDYNRISHGYGIVHRVSEDSLGRITLGSGILYGTLKKLKDDDLIEDLPELADNSRRISYRLTKKGWDRLEYELAYYQNVVKLAQERGLL